MEARASAATAPAAPIWGELRYGRELVRLLVGEALRRPQRAEAAPVLLIPGFMAGDASLAVLRGWLRRRGHPVAMSGLRMNVGCAERILGRLQDQLAELVERWEMPAVVIGQSRGGALARALAVREPDRVGGLVMLGSPVRDPLAVSPGVLGTVRLMARLGDLGLPGLFTTSCADGGCCEAFWEQLEAPLPAGLEAVSIHSRSDAIVDWRACLDPHARNVEVDSSHCGMSVHPSVYRTLERTLASFSRS